MSQTPPKNHKQLLGTVSREGFSIRPTSYYRGSLTYLIGKFIAGPKGVRIEMYVIGPLYFILPFSAAAALCLLLISIVQGKYDEWSVPLGVFLGSIIGLFVEADRLDWFVGQILEKYIVE